MKETFKTVIYVGAKPDPDNHHAGGQATASLGLIDYAERHGIDLTIIDSVQESFPPPSLWQRLRRAGRRIDGLTRRLFRRSTIGGVIIFCSVGFSFYEKSFLALLCRLAGVRCLLFVRSGHFMTACEHSAWQRRLNGWLLRIPHALGVQGENWRKLYRSMGIADSRLLTVRNWLAPGRQVASHVKSVPGGEPLTFLFVGWVVRKKGVNELIEAVAGSGVLRNSRLLIAGGGDLQDKLAQDVARHGLHNVELLGWRTAAQVDELLERAHVFVLPTYAEGFSNALLEALGQGLPVVTTPVGALPDSALDGENAEWVEPGDVESLRAAMEKFVTHPELVERYSARSLEIVRALHDRDANCAVLFGFFD